METSDRLNREVDNNSSDLGSTRTGMRRILYIEDDIIDRKALKRVLQAEEPHLKLVITAELITAEEILKHEKIDLILIDYQLRDLNGLDWIEAFKPKIPFIVLTGQGSEEIAVRAMKLGASDYLIKDHLGEYLVTIVSRIENVLEKVILQEKIVTLEELLPICSWCYKIRDTKGYWNQIEEYFKSKLDIEVTHSICETCVARVTKGIYSRD